MGDWGGLYAALLGVAVGANSIASDWVSAGKLSGALFNRRNLKVFSPSNLKSVFDIAEKKLSMASSNSACPPEVET